MGAGERRQRQREEVREKVLAAARDLFGREGYDAVSMRRIAEAVEYTPAALYVHFQDKESLFHELCSRDFAALADAFQDLDRVEDPVERVRQIGHAYVRFAVEHPNHYRLMFMTPSRPTGPLPEDALCKKGDPARDGYAFTRVSVEAAIHSGRFREEFRDVDLVTQTLWAAVHGLASLQIAKAGDAWLDWRPFDRRCRVLMDLVLDGMLLRPPAKRGGRGKGGGRAGKNRKAGTR